MVCFYTCVGVVPEVKELIEQRRLHGGGLLHLLNKFLHLRPRSLLQAPSPHSQGHCSKVLLLIAWAHEPSGQAKGFSYLLTLLGHFNQDPGFLCYMPLYMRAKSMQFHLADIDAKITRFLFASIYVTRTREATSP